MLLDDAKAFEDLLRTLAPALHEKEETNTMNSFCFTGEYIFAFDGSMALVAKFHTDFEGAVEGKLLLSIMRGATRSELDLSATAHRLTLKGPGIKASLPITSPDEFLFEVPNEAPEEKISFTITPELLAGLRKVNISIPAGDSIREQLDGMSIFVNKNDRIEFYASDATSMGKFVYDADLYSNNTIKDFMFPRSASAALKSVSEYTIGIENPKENPNCGFLITDGETAIVLFDSGIEMHMALKNIEMFNFPKRSDEYISQMNLKKLFEVPESLGSDLRKIIGLGAEKVTITHKGKDLIVSGRSIKGEVNLSYRVGIKRNEIALNVELPFLQRACAACKNMCIGNDMIYFEDGEFVHIVGGRN